MRPASEEDFAGMRARPNFEQLNDALLLSLILVPVLAAAAGALVFESVNGAQGPDFGERFAALLQAGGVVSAAVAFFGVAAQVRQANRALKAQLFDQTATRMAHLDELMLSQPQARARLLGRDPEDVAEQSHEALAEAVIDHFDTELLRQEHFGDLLSELPDFRPWIIQSLRDQAGLTGFFEHRLDWYSDELLSHYVRARIPRDLGADEHRLIFSRAGATNELRPDARGVVVVPPSASRGDLIVLRHGNGWTTVVLIIGAIHRGTAACVGLARLWGPKKTEPALNEVVDWSLPRDVHAREVLERERERSNGWTVYSLTAAENLIGSAGLDGVRHLLVGTRGVSPALVSN